MTRLYLLLVVAACSNADGPTAITVPTEWRACEASADCALIELECCDHCNGGTQDSVAASFLADAQALRAGLGCDEGCTLLGCADLVPTCQDGRCAALPADSCVGRAEAECVNTCGALTARRCIGNDLQPDAEFLACGAADVACGQALTCAIEEATGERWEFLNTCLPDGFQADTGVANCCTADCPGRTEAECTADDRCTALFGVPAEGDGCTAAGDPIYTGCQVDTLGCDAVETCAVGPEGQRLRFPSSCLPAGWTPVSG